MIRKAYIRNQARKESYLRERREGKKWSRLIKTNKQEMLCWSSRKGYFWRELTNEELN